MNRTLKILSMSQALGLNPKANEVRDTTWRLEPAALASHISRGAWLRARHLDYISTKLKAILTGPVRLIITLPPQMGKSSLVSLWTSVWFLANCPQKHVILGSYGQTLATFWGQQVRDTIAANEDELGIRVARGTESKTDWRLQQGGGMLSVGVGGPVTGRPAHCLPAGTLIATNAGLLPIEDLQFAPTSVKIISYDERGYLQEKAAEAFAVRSATQLYRITTTSGRVVEATGNHQFWTSRGYKEASLLTAGDTLLRLLPKTVHMACFHHAETFEKELSARVLFLGMFESTSSVDSPSLLRKVPETSYQKDQAVLRRMPATVASMAKAHLSKTAKNMPDVQLCLPGKMAREETRKICNLLQQTLCRTWTFPLNGRTGQSEMEKRSDPFTRTTPLSKSISYDEAPYKGKGQRKVPCLWKYETPACPPSRQLADEQCSIKFSNLMCYLPSTASSSFGSKTTPDIVARVEQLCKTAPVYDLQVADNHNFFANGILVHNCLIIDDPVKNSQEAESLIYRNMTWDWWLKAARTRLQPDASVVVVTTRWHMDDLAGRMMSSGVDEFELINLPALAEEDDALGRLLGEALWPERFTLEYLLKTREAEGAYNWLALYQQRPIPAGGGLFKREWFEIVAAAPAEAQRVRWWDFAATEGGGDYTVGTLMSRAKNGLYFVEQVTRGQYSPGQAEAIVKQTAQMDAQRYANTVLIKLAQEPGSSGKSSVAAYVKMLAGFPVYAGQETGSKELRARPFAAQCEAGNVKLVAGDWNNAWLDELCVFPHGAHDDQCFAEGTPIATLWGNKPIEEINIGDWVITPFGIRKVLSSNLTGFKPVINRFGLTGTGNHPIFDRQYGFKEMDALTSAAQTDKISLGGLIRWTYQKLLFSMTHPIGEWEGRKTIILVSRIPLKGENILKDFMWRFGNRQMANQFPKVVLFIIKTIIRLTTILVIWNAYRGGNIIKSIQSKIRKSKSAILRRYACWRPSGINLRRGGNGIKSTLGKFLAIENLPLLDAAGAVGNSNQKVSLLTFAPISVEKNIEKVLAIIEKPEFVASAKNPLKPACGIEGSVKLAECVVLKNSWFSQKLAKVYNLTIDIDHVYYAHGLLVSNCDSASGAFNSLFESGETKPLARHTQESPWAVDALLLTSRPKSSNLGVRTWLR